MFSKILVPVDLEESSRAVVEMAASLAAESNGEILAVHVMTALTTHKARQQRQRHTPCPLSHHGDGS